MGLGEGELVEQLPHQALAGRGALALDDGRVLVPAPERDPERLADGVARAVVVRVGVGEGVRRDRPAFELAQDALAVGLGARVDQDVTDQVDVDPVAGPAAKL
jgi:hypothetical protein